MNRNLTDGQIVSIVSMKTNQKYEEKVESFRIEYLIDGYRVIGFIVKPKNTDNGPLPVLIYNRGGNREYGKIDEERLERLASYAARNYVVLATQYRGNDGGEGSEEFGGADIRDIFAMSWLADTLPYADSNRKVMFGHSRGGLMTYIAIKLGIDIKAAAVVGAPSNLLRESLPFPMDQIHEELIGNKVDEREKFIARSALFWPDKINIPILILHGDNDNRVHVEDSIELSKLLEEHSKIYKLVIYPEGDHRLSNYQQERDKEIFEWFDHYLTY
ncbi:alpha/beta hydrolase family protein [Neobacillus sp. D3-1R]|uniref:alpha/beta hydrolase family protein n=1 Tax=Neobacillus sp. D3-1R TaxID=3445778 RepID=UPI003FA100C6